MRLLLIQPGAIGDFILTLPSFVWLKRKLKPNWLEIWTERVNLSLADAPGYADRAVALGDARFDSWPTPEAVFERLRSFDLVISWRGARNREWVEEVRRRYSNIHFLSALPKDSPIHAMDFRRAQLESLFEADDDFPLYPEITTSPEDDSFAREYLAEEISQGQLMVMIHPGSSGARKRWPAANFSLLISRLPQRGKLQILLCEGPLDHDVAKHIAGAVPGSGAKLKVRQVCIENLRHLAAVIKHCEVYVGNDSGITHLAAASGVSTLAIFTASDHRVWAPRGAQVKVLARPSVDEVLAKIGLREGVVQKDRT